MKHQPRSVSVDAKFANLRLLLKSCRNAYSNWTKNLTCPVTRGERRLEVGSRTAKCSYQRFIQTSPTRPENPISAHGLNSASSFSFSGFAPSPKVFLFPDALESGYNTGHPHLSECVLCHIWRFIVNFIQPFARPPHSHVTSLLPQLRSTQSARMSKYSLQSSIQEVFNLVDIQYFKISKYLLLSARIFVIVFRHLDTFCHELYNLVVILFCIPSSAPVESLFRRNRVSDKLFLDSLDA